MMLVTTADLHLVVEILEEGTGWGSPRHLSLPLKVLKSELRVAAGDGVDSVRMGRCWRCRPGGPYSGPT
jgi:hypothetical protein